MSMRSIIGFSGERVQPYKVRNQCGHVETRPMRPSTAGVPYDAAAPWQLEPKSDCADCQKMKAEVRQRQAPPIEGKLHVFYPEMYEVAAESRLFLGRYVHNCYSIEWRPERHTEALAVLQRLRVRPKDRGPDRERIELRVPGKDYLGKHEMYTALVTSAAYEKLGPYTTHEALLD